MGIRELRAKYGEPFEAFFNAYPRKIDRHRAQDTFIGLGEEGCDVGVLIEKAHAFARNVDPRRLQYVPSPHAWLRDRRWEDNDLFTDQVVAQRDWFVDKYQRGDAAAVAMRYGFIYNHPPIPDDVEDTMAWHLDQRKVWIGRVANHILHGEEPPE